MESEEQIEIIDKADKQSRVEQVAAVLHK